MRVPFNFNWRIRLEQNSFNKIVAIKINVIFEIHSTKRSSAEEGTS